MPLIRRSGGAGDESQSDFTDISSVEFPKLAQVLGRDGFEELVVLIGEVVSSLAPHERQEPTEGQLEQANVAALTDEQLTDMVTRLEKGDA